MLTTTQHTHARSGEARCAARRTWQGKRPASSGEPPCIAGGPYRASLNSGQRTPSSATLSLQGANGGQSHVAVVGGEHRPRKASNFNQVAPQPLSQVHR
jgi:hypothetical protein